MNPIETLQKSYYLMIDMLNTTKLNFEGLEKKYLDTKKYIKELERQIEQTKTGIEILELAEKEIK